MEKKCALKFSKSSITHAVGCSVLFIFSTDIDLMKPDGLQTFKVKGSNFNITA